MLQLYANRSDIGIFQIKRDCLIGRDSNEKLVVCSVRCSNSYNFNIHKRNSNLHYAWFHSNRSSKYPFHIEGDISGKKERS